MYLNIRIDAVGSFKGSKGTGWNFSADFPRFLIGKAWRRGCSFEDLADGFGEGAGTMGGDWSGIRDSTEGAIELMLERALNFLFGGDDDV